MIPNFCLLCQRPGALKPRMAICETCNRKLDRRIQKPMNEAMELERRWLEAKPLTKEAV